MNKRTKKLFAVMFTLLVGVNSYAKTDVQGSDTLKLNLNEALTIALSENLTVKIAEKEISKTGFAKKGTYSSLYPQINFSGSYQRTLEKQTMYMGENSFKVGLDNSWSTGFDLSIPIISVPLWKSLKISAMDVELAVEKARGSKIDLVDQVQQTYFSILLAKDTYNVLKENYDNALKNFNEVKKKYEAGTTSKYDMISAEITAKNIEPNVYDAQNNIELLKWKLKALIGIELQTEVDCIEALGDYESSIEVVNNNQDLSLVNNTQLKQLEMQLGQLEQTYKMQLAQFYPSLNGSISYQWFAMANNFRFNAYKWNPYSVGGVSLVIPIFSGGKRYYNLKQTRVQQEQLELQRENAVRELEVGIRQSLNSMETSVKQYNAALSGIEGAQLGYEISERRYQIGSGTLLEMDASRISLLQSKLNLYQSIYNFLIARSSLEKIIGSQLTNGIKN